MLDSLNIRNFALIEDLTIDFGRGFNVLSGETGAGKSIIIGALKTGMFLCSPQHDVAYLGCIKQGCFYAARNTMLRIWAA